MFCNPYHQIKNNEIINLNSQPNEHNRKFNIQLMTALLMKLLDLFLNCKIFAHKKHIADLLVKHSNVFKLALIKDELVQVLSKGIRKVDEYTRIMAAKIIPSYTEMFEKDLIVFEYILHRVQIFDCQQEMTTILSMIER